MRQIPTSFLIGCRGQGGSCSCGVSAAPAGSSSLLNSGMTITLHSCIYHPIACWCFPTQPTCRNPSRIVPGGSSYGCCFWEELGLERELLISFVHSPVCLGSCVRSAI